MFSEKTGRQYISRSERPGRGELLFVFNQPVSQEWNIDPVNFDPPVDWKLIERNPQMDSIRFWITDPETRNIDNMRFHATYQATGPSDSLSLVSDSINLNYSAPLRSRRQEASDQVEPVLEPQFGLSSGGNQELNRNLRISFPLPIAASDLSKMTLSVVQNSSRVSRDFKLAGDSLRIRNYQLITEWLPGQEYRFTSTPGAFTDIFGLESDSIEFNFKTRERDHYGSIILTITGVNDNIILQVLDERELVLREYFLDADGKVVIDYLQPAKYLFKVIFDTNKNRKWDTGNYLKSIQPERVIFYRETVATRSNWDIEVEWDLDD